MDKHMNDFLCKLNQEIQQDFKEIDQDSDYKNSNDRFKSNMYSDKINTIDEDFEGENLHSAISSNRRAKVLE